MEFLTARQEYNQMRRMKTNYSSERKLMTLRNKLVKYTKRNGPPRRYQYEHQLAIGNLKKASYDMERSDILRRFAELFDDEMIRSNKLSKIPADQHTEYDRQIAKARRRIEYMNKDIY